MNELDRIRQIFPDWPSEYDEAKQASSWFTLAQEYYCAAFILEEEINKNDQLLHSKNGIVITDEIAMRMHGHEPAIFCFAFAIELLIKALFVKNVASNTILPNQTLNFANHKISDLVINIKNLILTKEEKDLILKIEEIVVSGKYPTSKKPSDSKTRERLPCFSNFKLIAQPLYKKLMTPFMNKDES